MPAPLPLIRLHGMFIASRAEGTNMERKTYTPPVVHIYGSVETLTAGNMGSFNDGTGDGGAGAGMAELDGM